MKKVLLILGCFLLIHNTSFSQFYDNGQDPFSTNWKVLETANYKVIFSEDIDSLANVYANYLEKSHTHCKKTLQADPKKLPVVLHNQTIITNGEVGWAPRRMNLYLVGDQEHFYQPWSQHLVTHEVRHNFQLTKLNQGFTKGFGFLFGEIAAGAVLGLHLPMWFIEGDAVSFETGTTYAGRGRMPDFSMKLKAQVNEAGIYSYPKAIFGSYKNFVPGRYELGYYLVSKGRLDYGPDLWNSTMDYVAKWSIHPKPFSKGIKNTTGLPERKFYKQSLFALKDTNRVNETTAKKEFKHYSNYYNPMQWKENLVVLKTSLGDIPKFVLVNSKGDEQVLVTPGTLSSNTFSLNDSVMVWNEYYPTRFYNQNYNNIVVYNLYNHKKTVLTKKARIFNSRISPNGKTIVSVEVDEKIQWFLTFRDSKTGVIIKSLSFNNKQIIQPEWSPNGESVVFIQISNQGKSLGILNYKSDKIDWLVENEKIEISNPKFSENSIIVKGTNENVSNFFSYNLQYKEWNLMTNAVYGVGEGSIKNDNFYFTRYTSTGFKIDSINIEQTISQKAPMIYSDELSENLSVEEEAIDYESDHKTYTSSNYSRILHLFNLHSWAPMAMRVKSEEVGLGVSLMSQNALSTSFLEMGFQNNMVERNREIYLEYDYKGFYPMLSFRNSLFLESWEQPDIDSINREINQRINISIFSATVPIYNTWGCFANRIYLQASSLFYYKFYKSTEYFHTKTNFINTISLGLQFITKQKQSHRDLYSKWGQTFYVDYEYSPFDVDYNYNLTLENELFFPGLLANHSFRLYHGFQSKKESERLYSLGVLYPRGTTYSTFTNINSFRVNYSLPLLYPDLNIFEALYIKRLKANLFYDYAKYSNENNTVEINTTGIELTSDLHALRFIAPIEIGIQYARLLNTSDNYFGFLLSLDFGSF
ncbi:MAG: hypothetical protein JEZ09_21525 [Salinivirgaceae bacterium]|nr:hypothetical protein [Salinivirgaceae bacterium]